MFLRWLGSKFHQIFRHYYASNDSILGEKQADLIGEWQSLNGYYLIIHVNQASFHKIDYLQTSSQIPYWGKLSFVSNSLIISHLYSQKYLHIDRYPFAKQGQTCMVLNGMLFTKIG